MSAPRSAEPTLNEPDITLWPNEQYGEKKQDHADPWISSGAAGMEEARDQEAHGHHVKDEAVRAEVGEAILHRGLKTRHMTMISIGSVIGTGALFTLTVGETLTLQGSSSVRRARWPVPVPWASCSATPLSRQSSTA